MYMYVCVYVCMYVMCICMYICVYVYVTLSHLRPKGFHTLLYKNNVIILYLYPMYATKNQSNDYNIKRNLLMVSER